MKTQPTKQQIEVEKLLGILGLINVCRSIIKRRYELCEQLYGRGARGNIMADDDDITYINRYLTILKRLKLWYNSTVLRLSKFNAESAKTESRDNNANAELQITIIN